MTEIDALKQAILRLEKCEAEHVATMPVHEAFQGKTVWQGEVEVFNLIDHPRTTRCYAWSYQDDDGKTQYTVVLKIPPVNSPQDAVKAALVAQARNEGKET